MGTLLNLLHFSKPLAITFEDCTMVMRFPMLLRKFQQLRELGHAVATGKRAGVGVEGCVCACVCGACRVQTLAEGMQGTMSGDGAWGLSDICRGELST